MRIVVTGASGFVGRQLVPLLKSANVELLLAGRDTTKLASLFTGVATCDYVNLQDRAKGFDALINLAVLNTDSKADLAQFRSTNVDFLKALYQSARSCGIRQFFDISSTRALNLRDDGPYALSKREGTAALSAMPGPHVTTLYLPALYHRAWSGKMALLNNMPRPIARALFAVFAALKPTLDISRLVQAVLSEPYEKTVILTDSQDRNRVFSVTKRAFDLLAATAIILLLWWLLLVVWLAVRSSSPGPGIFAQTRVGRGGAKFTCYKFRTMKIGTTQAGTHEVSTSAVTSIGAVLRRTKLDELPQVWNILRNEISLVGPRPCLPSQVELINARTRNSVYALKPGITGLAQINGVDMSDPDLLAEWDGRYVRLQSLVLDLGIILATARGGGRGDNVRLDE